MKKLFTLFMLLLVSVLITGCGGKKQEQYSYVTVEINPKIEIVVSGDIVSSINGLNDDGKLLLEDENFVGKNIDEVCKEIVRLSEELGFIYSSEENNDTHEIKITVTAEEDEVKEKLEEKISNKVNEFIEKVDIEAKVNFLKEKEKEYFIALAMKFDPTLSAEEADKLTNQELMQIINLATLEKAEFATIALEEYYESFKEYEFKFKYKELLVSELNDSYSTLRNSYNELLVKLENEIIKLNETKISFFSSPDSEYVKAVNQYNEKKKEVIALKVEIENSDNPNPLLELKLQAAVKALDLLDIALQAAEDSMELTFDIVIKTLETILTNLEELEKDFPESIDFDAKFTEAEKYINDSKDELIAKYESSVTKEKIDAAKENLKTRKQELKDLVEESKNK